MEGIFVPLGVFAMVVAIVYLSQQHRQRMLLIQKGLDPKMLEFPRSSTANIKWGIVLVALGIGILIAKALSRTIWFRPEEAYFSMLFLFGGAALLLFHFLDNKKRQENQ